MEALPAEVTQALETPSNDLGKYVLIELLGRGGSGEVYKAWEKPLSRYVALKLLRDMDPDSLARFEREARLAAALNHPNIAAIYELGRHENRIYISMQFIDGQTLDQIELDLRRGVEIAHQCAQALSYAHAKGVIHRDINPRNVMVDAAGNAFITDFGIAREKKAGGTLTQTGMVVGTPAYMSPEQAQGLPLDDRTDVYSLGAALYFLCARSAPFLGDEAVSVIMKVVHEDPTPVRALNPSVDRALATIVEKAMEKDRGRRYLSAREFAEDLRRYLAELPIHAKRRGLLVRTYRRLMRRRAGRVAVRTTILLLAVATTVLVVGTRSKNKQDRREQASARLSGLDEIIREFEYNVPRDPDRVQEKIGRFNDILEEILSIDPQFGDAYVKQAKLHWTLRNRDEAFASLRKALQVEKENALAYLDDGRYRLKEYLSMKIRAMSLSSNEKTPDMEALLKKGLTHFNEFKRLETKQTGQRGAGEAELAFAHAVESFVQSKYEQAKEQLKFAQVSTFVEKDARLLAALVAVESGAPGAIEESLAGLPPTPDYWDARTYIAVRLLLQQVKAPSGGAEQALVEDLAHMMKLVDPAKLESAFQLPGNLRERMRPYFDQARRRLKPE